MIIMIITLTKIILTIDGNTVSWKSKVPPLSERQFTGNALSACALISSRVQFSYKAKP